MRTLFLACIPILTAFIGYLFSIKYQESKIFWDKFTFWHKKIKNEITFSQNPLPEILKEGDESDTFFTVAAPYLKDKSSIIKLKLLSDEENDFLNRYLNNLGNTDKNSQLNFLNSIEQELEIYSKTSDNKSKKYRPLFIKLGFLFGIIVFILII